MSATKPNLTLGQKLVLFILRIVGLAAIAGCTMLGYGVYLMVSGTGASSTIWRAYTDTMGAAGRAIGMDPIVASLIVPGLITSSLAMAVVLFMHKRS